MKLKMSWPNILKKRHKKIISPSSLKNQRTYEWFCPDNSYSIYPLQSLQYYSKNSAVYTAISLLASEISSLIPVVFDPKSEKFIDHPVLDLLKTPNKGESYHLFINSIATTLIASGNVFLTADGNINRPPLFLNHYDPSEVYANQSMIDKFPQGYNLNTNNISIIFERLDIIGKNRFLYVTKSKDSEIIQSRVFSQNCNDLYGMSPLSSICKEIMQLDLSNQHNLSVLEKGGSPSGILYTSEEISDDKFEAYKAALNEDYSGSTNAGRLMLLDNADLKYEELGKSNKDMDFVNLKQNVTNAIYSALKIPLPLISSDQMTLANMETARLNLYDNAVLPWANKIFSDLTRFLMPRYPSSEHLEITYNKDLIDALQIRRNEELSQVNELNALTVNEIRGLIGREELAGGNDLYQPQTLVPFASDTDTSDNIMGSQDSVDDLDKFINQFKQQVKPDGTAVFSDEDIKILIKNMAYLSKE